MIKIVSNGWECFLYVNGENLGSVDLTTVELLSSVLGFNFDLVEEE